MNRHREVSMISATSASRFTSRWDRARDEALDELTIEHQDNRDAQLA